MRFLLQWYLLKLNKVKLINKMKLLCTNRMLKIFKKLIYLCINLNRINKRKLIIKNQTKVKLID